MVFDGANLTLQFNLKMNFLDKNFFLGNNSSNWSSNASSQSCTIFNLYNFIDLEIYSEFEWMKHDFIVHPGGNTSDIKTII